MYKLLIVDDEQIERNGLRIMVERLLTNVEVVAEAANGREAIEAVARYSPDIVTMDIKMPGIDGLQATRDITKNHPGVKVVIFSAYDTFSYAQEAMQLGVKDYVLKPYSKEEVVKVITRIVHAIEAERREREEKLALTERYNTIIPLAEAELLSMLIFKHVQEIPKQELSRLLDIDDTGSFVMLFRFWREADDPLSVEQQEHLYITVKNVLKKSADCLVGPMIGEHIPVAVFERGHKISHATSRSQALQLFRAFIRQFTPPMTRPALFYAVGAGCKVDSLKRLRHSYQEALLALGRIERPQHICFYDEIENDGTPDVKVLLQKEKQLLEAVREGNETASARLFDEIFYKKSADTERHVADMARYVTGLFAILYRALDELGGRGMTVQDGVHVAAEGLEDLRFDAFATIEEIYEAAWTHLRRFVHIIQYRLQQQHGGLLHKAKQYLEKHFHMDISLETAAAHVGLSSYYFSKLFKEYTGVNFIDELTRIRVERAKQLLFESELSLKEICYEVGYNDPNYFSRVFKKAVGMTPSHYRRKQGTLL